MSLITFVFYTSAMPKEIQDMYLQRKEFAKEKIQGEKYK